jgi:GNAT superfamily N-acetyltransferase
MNEIKVEVLNGQYDLVKYNEGRIIEMLKKLSKRAPEVVTADDIERMLTQDNYYLFAAVLRKGYFNPKEDLITGVGIIFFRETLMGYKGFIEDVVVHDDHERKGVGTAIGKAMLEQARKKRVRKIELRSGNQREGGHALWLKLGFKAANSTPFDLYYEFAA